MTDAATGRGLPAAVRELAAADFTRLAQCFGQAGFAVRMPARGILQLTRTDNVRRPRLLLSVGVHGDETAPIEMLALLLDELAGAPQALAPDLMAVVGNPAAIAAGRRYLDADLNRMFDAAHAPQSSAEAARAGEIMRAVADFFSAGGERNWHLDLHAAIHPSHYPTFAVVPACIDDARRNALLGLMGAAGIGAAILNSEPAATFSAYTAAEFGAAAATVELGRIGAPGANDLGRFAAARAALDAFLRCGRPPAAPAPQLFRVAQELVKRSDAFRLAFDRDTWNFTALPPGAVIAEDGELVYRVGAQTEYVVFPNPDVCKGLRAGLMVVRGE